MKGNERRKGKKRKGISSFSFFPTDVSRTSLGPPKTERGDLTLVTWLAHISSPLESGRGRGTTDFEARERERESREGSGACACVRGRRQRCLLNARVKPTPIGEYRNLRTVHALAGPPYVIHVSGKSVLACTGGEPAISTPHRGERWWWIDSGGKGRQPGLPFDLANAASYTRVIPTKV